jgi:6-phosphogluconolactonase (cycloisomerase 2 family)
LPTNRRLIRALVCAGVFVAPAPAFASGWVYTESNNPTPGHNSVLALRYGSNGTLTPANIREYSTHGTGAPLILGGKSVGTLAGDQEVQITPNHKWLFAVNQGSNSIAVFKVNARTGGLAAVKGSPFPSGGVAPISVGYSKGRLVVANHGQIAPFDIMGTTPPGPASFTSFTVSSTGHLKQISTIPEPHAGLITAAISPSGGNVFSSGFYSQQINSLTLSSAGAIREAQAPIKFPASMTAGVMLPPFIPAALLPLPFGITTNPSPSKPYVYVLGPLNSRVAIYRYDRAGTLTFVGQADNPGSVAACWAVVTKDGRFMYAGNSATQNISLFDVSPSGAAMKFVASFKLPSTGTVRELAFDPNDKYLYASGGHDDPDGPRPQGIGPAPTFVLSDVPADGNFIDAFKIAGDGRLTPISSTALPVAFSQLPYGLATLGG